MPLKYTKFPFQLRSAVTPRVKFHRHRVRPRWASGSEYHEAARLPPPLPIASTVFDSMVWEVFLQQHLRENNQFQVAMQSLGFRTNGPSPQMLHRARDTWTRRVVGVMSTVQQSICRTGGPLECFSSTSTDGKLFSLCTILHFHLNFHGDITARKALYNLDAWRETSLNTLVSAKSTPYIHALNTDSTKGRCPW